MPIQAEGGWVEGRSLGDQSPDALGSPRPDRQDDGRTGTSLAPLRDQLSERVAKLDHNPRALQGADRKLSPAGLPNDDSRAPVDLLRGTASDANISDVRVRDRPPGNRAIGTRALHADACRTQLELPYPKLPTVLAPNDGVTQVARRWSRTSMET